MLFRTLSIGMLACALLACAREPRDARPEGAVSTFLLALARDRVDPDARREAFELLDEETRARLTARAREATALGAGDLPPWEMLAPQRSAIRFDPQVATLRVRDGETADDAIVVVTGAEGAPPSEVRVRREGERWRVVLELPDTRRAPPSE